LLHISESNIQPLVKHIILINISKINHPATIIAIKDRGLDLGLSLRTLGEALLGKIGQGKVWKRIVKFG
jgi:hypothetical protein